MNLISFTWYETCPNKICCCTFMYSTWDDAFYKCRKWNEWDAVHGKLLGVRCEVQSVLSILRCSQNQTQAIDECKKWFLKINLKIKQLTDDLHRKLASHLCNTYTEVCVGNYTLSKWSKTSNSVWEWTMIYAFYKFHQRLHDRACRMPMIVETIDEHYTSKTCASLRNHRHQLRKFWNIQLQSLFAVHQQRLERSHQHHEETLQSLTTNFYFEVSLCLYQVSWVLWNTGDGG